MRQTVTQFTRERVPIGLGVLLDISDSMFGKRIDDARAAVERFLFELLDPADEFFLMAFNHRPRPLTGWTRDAGRRAARARRPAADRRHRDLRRDPRSAADASSGAPGSARALLVISDGADTASTATLRELRSALLRSDAFVYAIAIDSPERQADQHAGQRRRRCARSPPRPAAAPKSCRTRRN